MMIKINEAFWYIIIKKDEGMFYWYAITFNKKAGIEYLIAKKSFSDRKDALNNWKEFCKVNEIKGE